jgi:hypothetical protein
VPTSATERITQIWWLSPFSRPVVPL